MNLRNKAIVSIGLFFTSFGVSADSGCLGIHSINPETFVKEQHPLRYVNCPCNCSQYRWSDSSRCGECNHKHAENQTMQTAKTSGNFITFMTPSEAVSAKSFGNAEWFEALVARNAEKQGNSKHTPPYFSEKNSQ